MLAQIEPGGEPLAGAGQHDGRLRVVAFEPVERLVQVGEEGPVLRVDRVGRHRHDGDPTPPLDRRLISLLFHDIDRIAALAASNRPAAVLGRVSRILGVGCGRHRPCMIAMT